MPTGESLHRGASLDGNVRRAIDLHEDEKIDEKAFAALIRAAVALNQSTRRTTRKAATPGGVTADVRE